LKDLDGSAHLYVDNRETAAAWHRAIVKPGSAVKHAGRAIVAENMQPFDMSHKDWRDGHAFHLISAGIASILYQRAWR
jgi:hypothetical protein